MQDERSTATNAAARRHMLGARRGRVGHGRAMFLCWPIFPLVVASAPLRSGVHEIDVLRHTMLPETINEPITMSNVAFQNNTFHLYNVSSAVSARFSDACALAAYKRFEGGKQLWDLPRPAVVVHREPLDPETVCPRRYWRQTALFYSPWHVDNMFHLHNDNVLPIVHTIQRTPGCNASALTCAHPTVLYRFPGSRASTRNRVAAAVVLDRIVDSHRSWRALWGARGTVCISQVVWGRGPYLMYAGNQPWYTGPHPDSNYWVLSGGRPPLDLRQSARRAVAALQRRATAAPRPVQVLPRAVYITRGHSGTRSIGNATGLLAACRRAIAVCVECCDWKSASFDDALSVVRDADLVFGPHGAGLAHILYARPGAKLVQFGDGVPWKDQFSALAGANRGGEFVGVDIGAEPWHHVGAAHGWVFGPGQSNIGHGL